MLVLRLNRGDVLLWRVRPRGLGREHDRSAVSVVGAHVATVVAPGALKPNPDIGLGLLEHVSQSAAARWHKAMPKSPVFVLGSQSW